VSAVVANESGSRALLRRLGLGSRANRLRRPGKLLTYRRTSPVSDRYGWDRGRLIDRFFIERFLEENADAIHGRVLEVADAAYTTRFGAGVTRSDVLDIRPENPLATIVADLSEGAGLPGEAFDCFILTQTLQFIYEVRAAVTQARRALKPGGVLLATVPSIQRVGKSHLERDYWRFTPASASALFGEIFGPEAVSVRPYGNLVTSVAFLRGMALEEVPRAARTVDDPFFATTIAVRAERRPDR
jgi:SAM-dependent methyltransferase